MTLIVSVGTVKVILKLLSFFVKIFFEGVNSQLFKTVIVHVGTTFTVKLDVILEEIE